ncbi:malonate transporter subunit MadL [Paracoccus marinaquae]|uniref:Malonate transporter subunit MadL n=1 Tax=Paracoccus marinaquae TaxID=2841926 RepID=A0ABS6APU3_9RHOB|nr:malonate transporter subunit MadL [Paracoccus marinaquae]MBU3031882.1 malonate transporter subunit MadL [Paracoccus marinaquae]
MIIYGVAVLAGCLLAGMVVGDALGVLLGVEANVGGVGFAMLLLIVLTDRMRKAGRFPQHSAEGVLFWSAMYIPIVVAMASTQNVVSAVGGGPVALLAGVAATGVCWSLVPVLSRIGGAEEPLPPVSEEEEV